MAANSSKLRNSSPCSSFLNLLLSIINFVHFILSAASLAPIITLRTPPTPLGWTFITISWISLLSSFTGFYSQLTRFCYNAHATLLIASLAAQSLGILTLFFKEKSSLSMLKSPRDPREVKLLVRLECGILVAMFVVQMWVLVLGCALRRCLLKEYEGLEVERDAAEENRRERIARIQEESMANAVKIQEMKGTELDEKMKTKYGGGQHGDFEKIKLEV